MDSKKENGVIQTLKAGLLQEFFTYSINISKKVVIEMDCGKNSKARVFRRRSENLAWILSKVVIKLEKAWHSFKPIKASNY